MRLTERACRLVFLLVAGSRVRSADVQAGCIVGIDVTPVVNPSLPKNGLKKKRWSYQFDDQRNSKCSQKGVQDYTVPIENTKTLILNKT